MDMASATGGVAAVFKSVLKLPINDFHMFTD